MKPTARKLGSTHIWFKDKHGHEKVVPIATLTAEQGSDLLDTTFHCGGNEISRRVFNDVIAILSNTQQEQGAP